VTDLSPDAGPNTPGPDDALLTFQRVSALLDLGRPREAAEELSRALARSPDDPVFWRLMSLVRGDLDEYPEALEAARRAVALAPDESRSHVVLGVALWNAQVVGRRLTRVFPRALKSGVLAVSAPALAALREALRLDPDNVEAHVHLAGFLQWLRKQAEAKRHYELALQIDPGHQDAQLGLARLTLRRRPAEAEQRVRDVLAKDPASVNALGLLARTQLRRRQGKAALGTALAAVRLDPANREAQAQFRETVNAYLPPPSGEIQLIDSAYVWTRNRWRMSRLSPEMRAQVQAVHRQQPRSAWRHPAVRILTVLLVVAYVALPMLVPPPLAPRIETLFRVVFFAALGTGLIAAVGWVIWKRRSRPQE
jgi:tetratricopeptide (TPR) repeat protein